jgi:hypothetical protein
MHGVWAGHDRDLELPERAVRRGREQRLGVILAQRLEGSQLILES